MLRIAALLASPPRVRFTNGGGFGPALRDPNTKSLLGLVGHSTLLYDELTASENLTLFAQLCGLEDEISGPKRPAQGLIFRSVFVLELTKLIACW